ncbi:hypothetical protein H4R34_001853 [Dimargaris verticillata]|uniref:J domain-containing protein n=1 Tax=Dimargaris verticillata TaxID=2761393 RepID=A0A9W8EE39_9FUNG|nr:hypothetical protein H4R34_001853 [Dimargaris verticillata]
MGRPSGPKNRHFASQGGDASVSLSEEWTEALLEPEDPTATDSTLDLLEKEITARQNLYAVLNLSVSASDDEIRDNYKRLCLAFHPDKHHDPRHHQAARMQFDKIQRAYEVLSNPRLRALYDEMGEAGLDMSGDDSREDKESSGVIFEQSQVGQRFKTRKELREEIEHKILRTRQEALHNLIQSKGEIEICLNAVPVLEFLTGDFNDDEDDEDDDDDDIGNELLANGSTKGYVVVPTDSGQPVHIPGPAGPVPCTSHQGAATLKDSALWLTSPVRHAWAQVAKADVEMLKVKHSFEVPVTETIRAVIVGNLVSSNGRGEGNVATIIKHHHSSDLNTEYGLTLGKTCVALFKAHYQLGATGFSNLSATMSKTSRPPLVNVTLGRMITPTISLYTSVKSGAWTLGSWGHSASRRHPTPMPVSSRLVTFPYSSMALGLFRQAKKHNMSGEFQAGMQSSHLSASYNRKLDVGVVLQTSMTLSQTSGVACTLGTENRLTANTKLGWMIQFGYPLGVNFHLKVSRLGQKISIPLVLAQGPSVTILGLAVMLPVLTTAVLNHWVVQPYRQQRLMAKINYLREEYHETLAAKRQEAEDAVAMLQSLAEKRRAHEEKCDGLVVLEAWYGSFSPAAKNANGPSDPFAVTTQSGTGETVTGIFPLALRQVLARIPLPFFTQPNPETTNDTLVVDPSQPKLIDVTIPLQAMVTESKLVIPGGKSKADLIGFYDPCFGEPKQLQVTYRFHGRLHTAMIKDTAPLACPLKSHLL